MGQTGRASYLVGLQHTARDTEVGRLPAYLDQLHRDPLTGAEHTGRLDRGMTGLEQDGNLRRFQ